MRRDVVVVGQIARDLVLLTDSVPGPGGTARVLERREMLGGKAANQAVSLAQLGLHPVLLGVVGDDDTGGRLLTRARTDGIDVDRVVRRRGAQTGLIVDVVDRHGQWRYLEHLPEEVLLAEHDIQRGSPAFTDAHTVIVQLQQPPAVALSAARRARRAGCRVVLDGAPADEDHHAPLLATADVVRADDHEAELLTGVRIDTGGDALRAARQLLGTGPSLVVLGAGEAGNALAWDTGSVLIPLLDVDVVDTTGAGDAFLAALVSELHRGHDHRDAGRTATAAAALVVGSLGGRPHLTRDALQAQLARLDARMRSGR